MKAIDLINQLKQNPEHQRMQAQKEYDREKKIAEGNVIAAPIIKALHENGFTEINNLDDLLKLKKINARLTKLILEWIPKISNSHNLQEILVRALAIADKSFDGTLLVHLFDNLNSSFNLKWAVGNTIASAQVENITDWLESKLNNSQQPKENEMLVYAAIKYFSYEKATAYLQMLFKVFPLQVADAFTYIGRNEDLIFLRNNNKGFKGEVKKNIEKAIKKLSAKL